MSESFPNPQGIRQPALRAPERTGNVIADKANTWFFKAQWHASNTARKQELSLCETFGLPMPDVAFMPDFTEDHSRLLTKLSETITSEYTLRMLAGFEDIRETVYRTHGVDIMPQQMDMLQEMLANPDLCK